LEKLPIAGIDTKTKGGVYVIKVARLKHTWRCGTVEFDVHSKVSAFLEKTKHAAGWTNTGGYGFNNGLSEYIHRESLPDRFSAFTRQRDLC
jgi:NDP-sugar pyrophosphorylase family protein